MIRKLFFPDVHFPYEDKAAFGAAMEYARWFRPHHVYILGDWFDCYSVSQYAKNPDKLAHALEEEFVTGIEAIRAISKELKPQKM